MNNLYRTEYEPGDGTRYTILTGLATSEPGEGPGLFVACLFGNAGTAAMVGPPGDFLAWTYLQEKLQCRETTARAVAHFLNLRYCPDYAESLATGNGPMNRESLREHLPHCLKWEGRESRTREELFEVASDRTHGIRYSEEPRQ